jgi:hypothetical protein
MLIGLGVLYEILVVVIIAGTALFEPQPSSEDSDRLLN